MTAPLLEVKSLSKSFKVKDSSRLWSPTRQLMAVDDVSFAIKAGKTLGLVGESGCGKSTLAKTVLHLLKPSAGEVRFAGRNIGEMTKTELQALRKNVQIVFQDPGESLNAYHSVAEILEEPLIIHKLGNSQQRQAQVDELLNKTGLARSIKEKYPHELSGGQRQRLAIARAIALKPQLLVCDEPVSALDVSVQAQVVNLLLDLQDDMHLSMLFIAHDLAVVKRVSDTVAVMYLGKIVEQGDVQALYQSPAHPYTCALLSAIPAAKPGAKSERIIIAGDVPPLTSVSTGCRFQSRCYKAHTECATTLPELIEAGSAGHLAACLYPESEPGIKR